MLSTTTVKTKESTLINKFVDFIIRIRITKYFSIFKVKFSTSIWIIFLFINAAERRYINRKWSNTHYSVPVVGYAYYKLFPAFHCYKVKFSSSIWIIFLFINATERRYINRKWSSTQYSVPVVGYAYYNKLFPVEFFTAFHLNNAV